MHRHAICCEVPPSPVHAWYPYDIGLDGGWHLPQVGTVSMPGCSPPHRRVPAATSRHRHSGHPHCLHQRQGKGSGEPPSALPSPAARLPAQVEPDSHRQQQPGSANVHGQLHRSAAGSTGIQPHGSPGLRPAPASTCPAPDPGAPVHPPDRPAPATAELMASPHWRHADKGETPLSYSLCEPGSTRHPVAAERQPFRTNAGQGRDVCSPPCPAHNAGRADIGRHDYPARRPFPATEPHRHLRRAGWHTTPPGSTERRHDPVWQPARTTRDTRSPTYPGVDAGTPCQVDSWRPDYPAWPNAATSHGPAWGSWAHPNQPDTSSPPAAPPYREYRHPPPKARFDPRPASSNAWPLDNRAWQPDDWQAHIAPCPGPAGRLEIVRLQSVTSLWHKRRANGSPVPTIMCGMSSFVSANN
ncbi:hypothetical protein D3C78_665640 [compost metagenome]